MKKNLSLLIVFLLIQISGINANASETPSYEELMNVTLSKLNNSTAPDRYTTCIAELKRISAIYPEEWLTYYYVSLYEIQHTFNNHSSNNDDLLNDASSNIELLKQNKKADVSEVSTIEGYYYYAKIALNPSENGQLYYKNVLDAYQKALKYNPRNPRAQLLFLMFRLNMAGFTGSKQEENIYEQLTQIEKLFESENSNTLNPSWGKNISIAMKKKFETKDSSIHH